MSSIIIMSDMLIMLAIEPGIAMAAIMAAFMPSSIIMSSCIMSSSIIMSSIIIMPGTRTTVPGCMM